jgi:hypothetical protein
MTVAIRSMPKFLTNRASGMDDIRHEDLQEFWAIRFSGRENGAFRPTQAITGADHIGRQIEVLICIECSGAGPSMPERDPLTPPAQWGLARQCNSMTVYLLRRDSVP